MPENSTTLSMSVCILMALPMAKASGDGRPVFHLRLSNSLHSLWAIWPDLQRPRLKTRAGTGGEP